MGWFVWNNFSLRVMLLFFAIIIICFEAVTEGLIKRHSPAVSAIIFKWWLQWLIAGILFVLWLLYALQFDGYYVPVWKMITGFVFVRFLVFDNVFNFSAKLPFDYIGTMKGYDQALGWIRDMWGFGTILFMKFVFGGWGMFWLLGYKV